MSRSLFRDTVYNYVHAYDCVTQMSEVCLTESIKSDERKFEIFTRDRSQAFVLQVCDKPQNFSPT